MMASSLRSIYSLARPNSIGVRAVSAQATAIQAEQQGLKEWKEIPGPSRIPFLGQFHHFLPGGELYALNFDVMFERLHNKYGKIVRFDSLLGKLPFIVLFDPETCAHVFRSENTMPIRTGFESLKFYRTKYGDSTKAKVAPNLESTGLLSEHGEPWKQFRSTVNPVLLQLKTIQQYTNMLDEVAQDMIARMRSLRGPKNTIESDFEMEMNLWALESIAVVSLGRRLHCFRKDLPENSPEKRLIKVVHDIIMFHVADALDIKPSILRFYETKTFKNAMNLYKEQESLTRYFIDETIKELEKKGTDKPEEEKSVLEKLLTIDKDLAVIMASDSLFAGVDTTSNTISGTLYLLAKNQDKQNILREEVFSNSDKRPYLKACIKESMRVMPIITGNMRMATKEYELHGYRIPKGVQITMNHQTMSKLESEYPQAKEYIPERWLAQKDDPLHHGNAHPFTTQGFGYGTRSCIGRRIAELEMEVFLTRIFKNFKVDWVGPPIKVVSSGLNYFKPPFNFTFTDL